MRGHWDSAPCSNDDSAVDQYARQHEQEQLKKLRTEARLFTLTHPVVLRLTGRSQIEKKRAELVGAAFEAVSYRLT